MILGLDTASAMSSAALVAAGDVLASGQVEGARQHAEALAPLIADVLDGADPEAIRGVACDVGPGPYSGLRVGIASAIAVGLAWNVPVYGVCSLDVIAAAALAQSIDDGFGVAIDARRNEVYWAVYSAAGDRIAGPRVSHRDAIPDGYRDGRWIEDELPHAAWVARLVERLLAEGVDVAADDVPLTEHAGDGSRTEDALAGRVLLPPRPLYLRRPDVTISRATTGGRP